ncbi:MAG: hypothetical protein NTZ09_03155 [Candidatus Hydrogenedentes bacterium]|nr:hypothetical protein [Candidatus Hydrogenedentota bacterium]
MRQILKRIIQRDIRGRVLHAYAELTVENGGNISFLSLDVLDKCDSCARPLKADDARGLCHICGCQTCSCAVACAVCSRNLCRNCRRGIIGGQIKFTVCPVCLPQAQRCAALAQELAIENARAQLLHSSLLDRLPGIGLVRQLAELQILGKLNELGREMERR